MSSTVYVSNYWTGQSSGRILVATFQTGKENLSANTDTRPQNRVSMSLNIYSTCRTYLGSLWTSRHNVATNVGSLARTSKNLFVRVGIPVATFRKEGNGFPSVQNLISSVLRRQAIGPTVRVNPAIVLDTTANNGTTGKITDVNL